MCLSEKMHYQLSHLSPPTTDGGVGGRQCGRQKGELDAQAEPGWSDSSQQAVPD